MKALNRHLQLLVVPSKSNICLGFQTLSVSFLSSSAQQSTNQILTQEELTKINLLIPRLCLTNQLPTAIHLTNTALLTNPPLKSISLSILVDSLASQPDMARPMSLLTRLRHSPVSHHYLMPINTMLIASYFKKGKPKEALKLFNWIVRPGSPCVLDGKVCGILVNGFCRNRMVLEALKVVRAMVAANVFPGGDLKERIYRGLLWEARIREAMELYESLGCLGDGEGGEGARKVLALLDHMIANWKE
ncbi:hypothetical protein FEM48_Zijuj01G0032400 [Ziziphus jujuba var. spinosa]|uniref:Pentatricopeptide repeat-containing protein n=1 Tax=Ziziphus jujuba var. spinosa TaxID=714518 RepID=A0A978VYU2_ZIZJJ|nr:hypothetical protein FEM48_Zijuj01G0032400 [Ziziphus jujuba var. spinosa]